MQQYVTGLVGGIEADHRRASTFTHQNCLAPGDSVCYVRAKISNVHKEWMRNAFGSDGVRHKLSQVQRSVQGTDDVKKHICSFLLEACVSQDKPRVRCCSSCKNLNGCAHLTCLLRAAEFSKDQSIWTKCPLCQGEYGDHLSLALALRRLELHQADRLAVRDLAAAFYKARYLVRASEANDVFLTTIPLVPPGQSQMSNEDARRYELQRGRILIMGGQLPAAINCLNDLYTALVGELDLPDSEESFKVLIDLTGALIYGGHLRMALSMLRREVWHAESVATVTLETVLRLKLNLCQALVNVYDLDTSQRDLLLEAQPLCSLVKGGLARCLSQRTGTAMLGGLEDRITDRLNATLTQGGGADPDDDDDDDA